MYDEEIKTEWEKKLSQLLWEYMEEKKKNPEWFLEISTVLMAGFKATDAYMVSKQFWFIEWLVQNDKVEKAWQVIKDIDVWGSDTITWVDTYSDYESLLMLLSIQDEPVKFLSEMLKDE